MSQKQPKLAMTNVKFGYKVEMDASFCDILSIKLCPLTCSYVQNRRYFNFTSWLKGLINTVTAESASLNGYEIAFNVVPNNAVKTP